MKHLIEAGMGIFALGAPVILAGIGVGLFERPDGHTRLVIVNGRVRRRRVVFGDHERSIRRRGEIETCVGDDSPRPGIDSVHRAPREGLR